MPKEDHASTGFQIKQTAEKGANHFKANDTAMAGYYVYITKYKNEFGIWPISKKIMFNQV